MPKKEKEYRVPKRLGTCADKLYEFKQERLAAQKIVDEMKKRENAIIEHVIATLPKSDASGVSGKVARVMVTTKEVPTIKDFKKLQAHIKRTGNFDLLQRRLNAAAVNERWDVNKNVPGVEAFTKVGVSLTKV